MIHREKIVYHVMRIQHRLEMLEKVGELVTDATEEVRLQAEQLKQDSGIHFAEQPELPLADADAAQRARDAEWDTPAPGADSAREPVKESIDAGVRPRAAALLHRAETAIHAETKGNAIAAIRELRRVFGIGE